MPAKRKPGEYPQTVEFGAGRVRICRRANGFFKLTWREMGATRSTTKTAEDKALEFAQQKARELDGATGRRLIAAGDADALAVLRRLAGSEDEAALRKLVADVESAKGWLGGAVDLTTACRWYAERGPLKVERTTVAASVALFLAEYVKAPKPTRNTFTGELDAFAKKHPKMMMLELTQQIIEHWCDRPLILQGEQTTQRPSDRTRHNRLTTWVTFLNRARDWKLLPDGKHAADLVRKPTLPDEGKQIFLLWQGKKLLAEAMKEDVRILLYLLIAGWLGLRPSEIDRLMWEEEKGIGFGGFDWDRNYLHVSARVAGKNSSERFIPMDPRLSAILKMLFVASGQHSKSRVCIRRCREYLSLLARRKAICGEWPTDVLRHSFCSYRIAVVKSLDQVATEADNSPAILKSNYRKPLRHEDGIAWWDLLESVLADLPARISRDAA